MKLIFNADDLGWSRGINRGILDAYRNGVVNSTSLMCNTPYFGETIELIKREKLQNIGLHGNLTEGLPLLKTHQTLCDSDGKFFRKVSVSPLLNPKEAYEELNAQYLRAIKAGVKITHLDSHHHIHTTKSLRKVFCTFAKEHQLPIRRFRNKARRPSYIWSFYRDTKGLLFRTDNFSADFYDTEATVENLLSILERYKGKELEIMCHPGYEEPENGIYNEQRARELKILCDDRVKDIVDRFRNQ